MERFRTPFHGKSSPVQFFWGGFDLDATRFNGKPATPPSYGGRIMEYGEDAESFAIGFWPGTEQFHHTALYAYITPAPAGIAAAQIQPGRRTSMRRSASSCSSTTMSVAHQLQRRRPPPSSRAPTRPPRIWRAGIARPWKAASPTCERRKDSSHVYPCHTDR